MQGTLPRSLDHFNVSAFPELQQAYGEAPKSMVIFLPSDEVLDFFDCNFELWGGRKGDKKKGTKIRQCDAVTCVHRIEESVGEHKYGAGEESPCVCPSMPENDPRRCKYSAYLKAFIALPQTGKVNNLLCYTFGTHSKNSGDAIYSELEKVKMLTGGRLRGIPFAISVDMVDNSKDAKKKFPIWRLHAMVMADQLKPVTAGILAEVNQVQIGVSLDDVAEISVKEFLRLAEVVKQAKTVSDLTQIKVEADGLVKSGLMLADHYDELVELCKTKYDTIT